MKLLISLVLALTVQGEVFEPSESSTTPEIAETSAKGEDEENHLHDLIANPKDEAVKNLKPEALEGAKATTEMAGGVGAAVLGEKLKSGHQGHHHVSRRPGFWWMNFGNVCGRNGTSLPMHTQGSTLKTWAMMILAILEVLLHLGRVRQLLQKQVVQKTQHLRELSDDVTSHWLLLVRLLGSDAQ